MFRLLALICAGVFVYNLGHNAAAAPTGAAAEPAAAVEPAVPAQPQAPPQAAAPTAADQEGLWAMVAKMGGTWIARELHSQTAWAASDSRAQAAAPLQSAQPEAAQNAEYSPTAPVEDATVQSEAAPGPPQQNVVHAPSRGLKIEYAPSMAATAASLVR